MTVMFAFGYFISNMIANAADFYAYYDPVTKKWLAGQTILYDENSYRFFNPPWLMWMLLPISGTMRADMAVDFFRAIILFRLPCIYFLFGGSMKRKSWLKPVQPINLNLPLINKF